MRRAAARDVLRDLDELGFYFIEAPDLDDLHLGALQRPQELTVAERFRFERLITQVFSSFDMALDYRKDKLLSDETIDIYGQNVLRLFDSPTVMEWWERGGQFTFSPTFHDLVSQRSAA